MADTRGSVTKGDRPVRWIPASECRTCGEPISRSGRRRYCSAPCRKSAHRARLAGDPQALFDRWLDLIEPVTRYARAYREACGLEHELALKHALDPHEVLEQIQLEIRERAAAARARRHSEAAAEVPQ